MVLPFFIWCYHFIGQGIWAWRRKPAGDHKAGAKLVVSARPACALTASAGAEQGCEQRGAASRDRTNSPGWMGTSRRRWQAAARANSRYDGVIRRAVFFLPNSKLCLHIPSLVGPSRAVVCSGHCEVALCFSAPELCCVKHPNFELRAVSRVGYQFFFF